MNNQPNPLIAQRIEESKVQPKEGDKVIFMDEDGSELVGEIEEISTRFKNWITKVRVLGKDGKVTIKDVSELVVEVIVLANDLIKSNIFQKIANFFKNLFKKKVPKLA